MNTATIDNTKITRKAKSYNIDKFARKLVFKIFDGIKDGQLVIEDNEGTFVFGHISDTCAISARITVNHYSSYRDMLFGGSLGGAEAYMIGAWSSPNLLDVVRLIAVNINFMNQVDSSRVAFQNISNRFYRFVKRNSPEQAKRNIAAHYDLSNDFFSLILDKTMMYSSAIFPSPGTPLAEASVNKLDIVCQKLKLHDRDHLLEIGTGWGSMAIHAAKHYGCKVTTTTISRKQYEYTLEQVKTENLTNQVTVLMKDYRELDGSYDKLVSIEMLEAVGNEYYQDYFTKCAKLLKDNGLMLIQTITIPDQRYKRAQRHVDFIKRYIFPGGSLPSHEVISTCIRRFTDLQIVDLQEIGEDYARTLKSWKQNFFSNIDKVRALGFDEVFIRMWEYYLVYCEGGFQERAIGTAQYVFAKPGSRNVSFR